MQTAPFNAATCAHALHLMKLGTYWTHNPPMHTQSQGKGPTFRFSGAIQQSRNVADRSPTCHLAASTVAHGRPASVTACLRWLPIWLPAVGDPAVIGLHRSGFADRSLNSRTARQLSPVPGPSRLQRGLHHAPQRHLQLSHNLPSCLAHAAAPLMTDCQEARGGAALQLAAGTRWDTRQDWSGCPPTELEVPTRTADEISADMGGREIETRPIGAGPDLVNLCTTAS